MSLIKEKEFNKIANYQNKVCVSIFMPTNRGGKRVLENQSQKHLNSQWDEIRKELQKKKIDEQTIEAIGKHIKKLIDDSDFWRHQSDGLAIFASDGFFEKFSLPVNFAAHYYIDKEFYVKSLIPALNEEGRFNLLAIQLDDVKLYEITPNSVTPIEIEDITPSQLEERVGYDYKEKALQFRSQGAGGEKSQFHGHGGSERDEKTEIKQFFRAVDQGIQGYLNKGKLPLVVACQDYFFPIYKDANTYNHLVDQVVPGNPNDTDIFGLQEKALKVAEPLLDKKRHEKLEKYREFTNTKDTSSAVTDIIPAIFQGKVDTLFVENRAEIWGKYDEGKMKVKIENVHNENNTSLLNLAAKKTIEMGGTVYLVEPAFMPESDSKMNALFRYS